MFPNMLNTIRTGLAVLAITAIWPARAPAAESIIDDEIIRLRKELSRQQIECQRIRSDIDKENKDDALYRANFTQRVKTIMATMDSLKRDMAGISKTSDSLAAAIEFVRTGVRQIDYTEENTSKTLINACGILETAVRHLPPLAAQSLAASVSLLKSDLKSKSIDNIEGVNRLYTILTQLEEASGNIQVSQESSPSPDIRGTVYRVRIGSFFEAAVDEKGEKAVVFSGYAADGSPTWNMTDAQLAAAIYAAAVIREGKSLPAFVRLTLPDTLSPGNTP